MKRDVANAGDGSEQSGAPSYCAWTGAAVRAVHETTLPAAPRPRLLTDVPGECVHV